MFLVTNSTFVKLDPSLVDERTMSDATTVQRLMLDGLVRHLDQQARAVEVVAAQTEALAAVSPADGLDEHLALADARARQTGESAPPDPRARARHGPERRLRVCWPTTELFTPSAFARALAAIYGLECVTHLLLRRGLGSVSSDVVVQVRQPQVKTTFFICVNIRPSIRLFQH